MPPWVGWTATGVLIFFVAILGLGFIITELAGMRSCIGLSRSFAVVVMMAHEGMRLPSGSRPTPDHRPAKAEGSPERMTTRMGLLAAPVLCNS